MAPRDKTLNPGKLPPALRKQRHEYFDRVEVDVQGGHGGHGAVINLPRNGGPRLDKTDGGDLILPPGGGNGGSVVLFVDPATPDLLHLHARKVLKAERGTDSPGMTHLDANRRRLRAVTKAEAGEDADALSADGLGLRVPVPAGTFVRTTGGKVLGDLVRPGQELHVALGGRGGPCVLSRGAERLSRRRAGGTRKLDNEVAEIELNEAECVELTRGERAAKPVRLQLLLRTVADVGFVGLPNAGKSTLLSAMTRAAPEVAPYPFTTLMPNLGAMQAPDDSTSQAMRKASAPQPVLADLPGLVEGAHQGRGLGRQFLQQLRRVRLVLYVLDTSSEDIPPAEQYTVLRRELQLYNPEYVSRPHIVVLNKLDLPLLKGGAAAFDAERAKHREAVLGTARAVEGSALPVAIVPISAKDGKGLAPLQEAISRTVEACRAREQSK